MSKNREFSDTSASRYSLALYEIANESNSLSNVEKNSTEFLNLLNSNKDFKNFIKDPTVSQNILISVINKISETFKLEILFKNFLSFLIIKRRFFFVERILDSFKHICSEKRGELSAEIRSSKELSDNEINKIKDELSNNFNSKIKLNYKYDPNLIGGLVIQVGSTMVDTSIKNKLQQIENRLLEA